MILQGPGKKEAPDIKIKAQSDPILLSSGLYRRYRNLTGSCQKARGLYRRWGIAPRPEERYLTEKYTTIREKTCQSRKYRGGRRGQEERAGEGREEGEQGEAAISAHNMEMLKKNAEEKDIIRTDKLTIFKFCNIIDASSYYFHDDRSLHKTCRLKK